MKVKEIMTAPPATCGPDTTLADAAHLMWEADCGILPMVADGKLAGVVTDRDLYIALATRNKLASDVKVGDVATRSVFTCEPDDDVSTALATMKQHTIRRLPVVGFNGTVLGILSMNDLVLAAGSIKGLRVDPILETLQAICGHHHPAPHIVAA